MAISVQCGACNSAYSLSDKFAGSSVTCPNCQASISVPLLANPVTQMAVGSVLAGRNRPSSLASMSMPAWLRRDDWRFGSYWTGAIIRVLWVVGFAVILFDVLFCFAIGGDFIGLSPWQAVILGLLSIVALRVTLESISVLFDIAKTLHEIRDKNSP